VVGLVLVIGAVLIGIGTPVGVVLEVPSGGYVGTEIVRRLNGT
jgi:hypothetical protein